eukprot:4986446-Pleurochrysis_carterae.AAC.1
MASQRAPEDPAAKQMKRMGGSRTHYLQLAYGNGGWGREGSLLSQVGGDAVVQSRTSRNDAHSR